MGFLWTVCTLSEEVYSVLQQSFLAFLHWPVDQKTGLDRPLEAHLFLLPHERPRHWQSITDEGKIMRTLPFPTKHEFWWHCKVIAALHMKGRAWQWHPPSAAILLQLCQPLPKEET